jgi:site-specific recombinase XerD
MSNFEKHLKDYHSYMRLKNYSKQTVTSYLRTVRMFYEYRSQLKLRGRISEEHARKYLLMRIDSGCSWSTINCHPSRCRGSLRFKVHRTLPDQGRIA